MSWACRGIEDDLLSDDCLCVKPRLNPIKLMRGENHVFAIEEDDDDTLDGGEDMPTRMCISNSVSPKIASNSN